MLAQVAVRWSEGNNFCGGRDKQRSRSVQDLSGATAWVFAATRRPIAPERRGGRRGEGVSHPPCVGRHD